MLIIILKKMCILCLLMDSFMQIDYLLRMQVINASCKCFRRKCIFFQLEKTKKKNSSHTYSTANTSTSELQHDGSPTLCT